MKKVITFVLALMVAFLCACNNEADLNNSSVGSESNSVSQSENKESICDKALELLKDGKIKDAYALLYANRKDNDAKEMMADFKVLYTNMVSRYYSVYQRQNEYTYNQYGDIVMSKEAYRLNANTYMDLVYNYEYTYNSTGKKLTCEKREKGSDNYELFKYEYNDQGQLVCEESWCYSGSTAGTPKVYKYEYDSDGNVIKKFLYNDVDCLCECTYVYENGNLIKSVDNYTDGEVIEINYTYNEYNHVLSETKITTKGDYTDESTTEYRYEYDGSNIVKKTTVKPNKTEIAEEYEYNKNGDVTKKIEFDGYEYTSIATDYVYSENGAVVKKTETKDRWSINPMSVEYDKYGNILKKLGDDGDGYTYEYEYDSKGRVISKTTNEIYNGKAKTLSTVKYSYDNNGNLVSEKYSHGAETTYEYDEKGNLITEYDSYNQEKKSYTYNEKGDMISEKHYNSENELVYNKQIDLKYDVSGNVTEKTTAIDKNGYVYSYTDIYTYNDAGLKIKWEYCEEKGVILRTHTYSYDSAENLIRVDTKKGEDVGFTEYTYDELGNKLTESIDDNSTATTADFEKNTYSDYLYFYTE